jgi:DNA repair exonuclease SbcCD ATPase subunit
MATIINATEQARMKLDHEKAMEGKDSKIESKNDEVIMLKAELAKAYKSVEAYRDSSVKDLEEARKEAGDAQQRAAVEEEKNKTIMKTMVSQEAFDAVNNELSYIRKLQQDFESTLAAKEADAAAATRAASEAQEALATLEEKYRKLLAQNSDAVSRIAKAEAQANAAQAQADTLAAKIEDLVAQNEMLVEQNAKRERELSALASDLESELLAKKKELTLIKPEMAKCATLINEQRAVIANLKGADEALASFTAQSAQQNGRVEVVYVDKVVEKLVEVERIVDKIVVQEKIQIVYQDKVVEKLVEVPVERIVVKEVRVEMPVEKIVVREKIVEKIINVPIIVKQEVKVEVEKIVHVPIMTEV